MDLQPRKLKWKALKKRRRQRRKKPEGGAKDAGKSAPAPASPAVIRTDLKIDSVTSATNESELSKLTTEEDKRVKEDIELYETAEIKNTLESYIYEARNSLSDEWSDFVTPSDKQSFIELLDSTRSWLYEEGERAGIMNYKNKLAELKKLGDPIDNRRKEFLNRDEALHALQNTLTFYRSQAESQDIKYEHISNEDRDKIREKCHEVEENQQARLKAQRDLPKTDNPILLNSDILHAKENVEHFCNPIMNKPKPIPKKEEKKPEEKKPEEGGTEKEQKKRYGDGSKRQSKY